jgi:hypothetical protein
MVTESKRGKPTQVNIEAQSAAEKQRWKLEAKRRGWSMTLLIRTAVNRLLTEADARVSETEQRRAVG